MGKIRSVISDKRFLTTVAAIVVALGGYVVYAYNPEHVHLLPPCVFHLVTGLNCPGCGATRATHHLLHGELLKALHDNVFIVIFSPVIGYALVREILFPGSTRLPQLILKTRTIVVVVTLFIIFGILRNIPHYPFTLLSP